MMNVHPPMPAMGAVYPALTNNYPAVTNNYPATPWAPKQAVWGSAGAPPVNAYSTVPGTASKINTAYWPPTTGVNKAYLAVPTTNNALPVNNAYLAKSTGPVAPVVPVNPTPINPVNPITPVAPVNPVPTPTPAPQPPAPVNPTPAPAPAPQPNPAPNPQPPVTPNVTQCLANYVNNATGFWPKAFRTDIKSGNIKDDTQKVKYIQYKKGVVCLDGKCKFNDGNGTEAQLNYNKGLLKSVSTNANGNTIEAYADKHGNIVKGTITYPITDPSTPGLRSLSFKTSKTSEALGLAPTGCLLDIDAEYLQSPGNLYRIKINTLGNQILPDYTETHTITKYSGDDTLNSALDPGLSKHNITAISQFAAINTNLNSDTQNAGVFDNVHLIIQKIISNGGSHTVADGVVKVYQEDRNGKTVLLEEYSVNNGQKDGVDKIFPISTKKSGCAAFSGTSSGVICRQLASGKVQLERRWENGVLQQ